MSKKAFTLSAIVILVLAGAMTAFAYRVTIRDIFLEARKPALPDALPYVQTPATAPETAAQEVEESQASVSTEIPVAEPEEETAEPASSDVTIDERQLEEPVIHSDAVNLAVPFTSQAPHADWSLPYQEACEEASLVMVNAWMVGTPAAALGPDVADQAILDLVAWEEGRFGYYEDTTAEETAVIAREYFGYDHTEVLPITSMEDVKAQLAAGHAVILPAAGRKLGNPYFSGEGPLYHMLVAKGYLADGRIITNDPGTRRGADFLYDSDTLFSAIGDWNDGNPAEGQKVMIVVLP